MLKGIELLVGQNATITLTMKVATVGQDYYRDHGSATCGHPVCASGWKYRHETDGGYSDQRAQLAAACHADQRHHDEYDKHLRPGAVSDAGFLLSLDGQNVTQTASLSNFFGQTQIDPEAIAEYQVITNLFDVTMGQSTGVQIQAISKSGTNTLHGSALRLFP